MRIVNPIGRKGDDEAVKFLEKKGYKIVERNFRGKNGEIDIIAIDLGLSPSTSSRKKESILVFIEVKTRTSTQFGTPFEAITHWKLDALIRTAIFYKATHRNLPDQMRIDAISVTLDNMDEVERIEQIENISGF